MVSQTRRIVGLEDIRAMRFRCKACEGEVSMRLSAKEVVPAICPLCGVSWDPKARAIREVWHSVRRCLDQENGVVLLMEFDEDELPGGRVD